MTASSRKKTRLQRIAAILPPGWTVWPTFSRDKRGRDVQSEHQFSFEGPGKWTASKRHRSYTFKDAMGFARDVADRHKRSFWARVFG